MLVLSRKETQRIRVGDSVVVTIVKVSGDKVRVGIEAPSDMLVLRDELEAWDDTTNAPAPAPVASVSGSTVSGATVSTVTTTALSPSSMSEVA